LLQFPTKRAKRKQWTNAQIEVAMRAVKCESGINRAAIEHGVPHTTLKDRLNGRIIHNTNSGQQKIYESRLSTFMKYCFEIGYGKTRIDVMNFAQSVAKKKELLRKTKS